MGYCGVNLSNKCALLGQVWAGSYLRKIISSMVTWIWDTLVLFFITVRPVGTLPNGQQLSVRETSMTAFVFGGEMQPVRQVYTIWLVAKIQNTIIANHQLSIHFPLSFKGLIMWIGWAMADKYGTIGQCVCDLSYKFTQLDKSLIVVVGVVWTTCEEILNGSVQCGICSTEYKLPVRNNPQQWPVV